MPTPIVPDPRLKSYIEPEEKLLDRVFLLVAGFAVAVLFSGILIRIWS